jgi:hypothetical protein
VNDAVRALNAPNFSDVAGQAAYIRAISAALDALPSNPYHDATRARFKALLEGKGGGDDDSALSPHARLFLALMFIQGEVWFFALIEVGEFLLIAFWAMTIMLREGRGIPQGGILIFGLFKMMMGGWTGIILGTLRGICLLGMGSS